MGLFGDRKKVVKRGIHRKTDEQIDKQQARKEKQWAREKLLEKAKENPDLENQYIANLMGIDLKTIDPVERQKQLIKSKIVDQALKRIDEDPELTGQFVETQIEEIISGGRRGKGGRYEGGEYESPGSTIRQALEELRDVREFEEEVGGRSGGGLLGGLLTEKTTIEILKTLQAMSGKRQEIEEPTVIVKVDGQLSQMPQSQYEQLLRQGRIQPVGMLEESKVLPKEQPKIESPKPSEPSTFTVEPSVEPELPEFLQQMDLELIYGMMEYPPENFVEQLKSEVEQGVPQSILIWSFLTNTTYDEIVKLVTPYKTNSQVGIYVERLLIDEGKKWVEQVLQLVKEMDSG